MKFVKSDNMAFKKGDKVLFVFIGDFNSSCAVKKYSGEFATVVGPLEDFEHYDKEDVGQMYRIKFDNQREYDVFAEELTLALEEKEEETRLDNPYFVYEIGDIFHNDNNEDYIIIALDAEKDKAILYKHLNSEEKRICKKFYIGASGLKMHHWCHGHYFMEDFNAAVKWFNDEEEKKGITIEEFLKLYKPDFDRQVFFEDAYTSEVYAFYLDEIPDILKEVYVKSFINVDIDDENHIHITFDSAENNINMRTFYVKNYSHII